MHDQYFIKLLQNFLIHLALNTHTHSEKALKHPSGLPLPSDQKSSQNLGKKVMEFQPFGLRITEFSDSFPAFLGNKIVGYFF